jgi:hypothetical protein
MNIRQINQSGSFPIYFIRILGFAVAQLVGALLYKSEVARSMVSLEVCIDIILPAVPWPSFRLSFKQKCCLGHKFDRCVRIDNITTFMCRLS